MERAKHDEAFKMERFPFKHWRAALLRENQAEVWEGDGPVVSTSAAFAEDSDTLPSTHMVAHSLSNSSSRESNSFTQTYIYIQSTNIHKDIKLFFNCFKKNI